MQIRDIRISVKDGLHMRVAALLVSSSRKFKSRVVIRVGDGVAELHSILQLMILGAERGAEIRVIADGEDEGNAMKEVAEILTDGAGI